MLLARLSGSGSAQQCCTKPRGGVCVGASFLRIQRYVAPGLATAQGSMQALLYLSYLIENFPAIITDSHAVETGMGALVPST